MTKFKWTKETEQEIARLWKLGKTGLEIAEAIDERLTRNAVMGKLSRMGLFEKHRDKSGGIKPKPTFVQNPYVSKKQEAKTAYGTKKPLHDLKNNECIFPIGDPKEKGFGFCAGAIFKNRYCENHYNLCYRKEKS